MKGTIATLMMLALGACAPRSEPQFGSSELVGVWLMMSKGVIYPADCNSFRPIQYHSNGTTSLLAERANWRLVGNVLTETITEHDPPRMENEETQVEIGKQYVSRLRWSGRDRFWKRYADGEVEEFIRCPKAQ